ncbi:MAG: hypothetical protein RLZZ381_1284 [Cyanobacteriota bacterium]|jgi:hypothetical protein
MIFVIVVVSKSLKSLNGEPVGNILYEECTSLIKASSLEEAEQKAIDYANNQNTSYKNCYGETVTWTVKQVVEVKNLLDDDVLDDELDLRGDAVDLYSRSFYDYEAYQRCLYDYKQD